MVSLATRDLLMWCNKLGRSFVVCSKIDRLFSATKVSNRYLIKPHLTISLSIMTLRTLVIKAAAYIK